MKRALLWLGFTLQMTALVWLSSGCQKPTRMVASENLSSLDSGVIGGVPVAPDEEIAKSLVGIGADGQSGAFCTGVLVAQNLVMTAAHCTGVTMNPDEMLILFGSDLKDKIEKRRVQGGRVTNDWPLLTSQKTKDWGDIALLRFEGPVPEGFTQARLLGSPDSLKENMDVVLAGYGLTKMRPQQDPEKLMKATVKLTDSHFSQTELKFAQTNGKGACHGDSGGPAFAVINGKTFVIGVTSRSATEEGAMTCMEGSIYTSVPGQIEFLRKAASSLNSKDFVPNERIPQPAADL